MLWFIEFNTLNFRLSFKELKTGLIERLVILAGVKYMCSHLLAHANIFGNYSVSS